MNDFRKLEVWRKSMTLANTVYQKTKDFPKEELYGITNQMRRYSVSIPSNIAEGCAKSSSKEFARYLKISLGSAYELETQMTISIGLNYLDKSSYDQILDEIIQIQKMISKLRSTIKVR